MSSSRKVPAGIWIAAIVTIAVVAEGWLVSRYFREASQVQKRLARVEREWRTLEKLDPSASETNANRVSEARASLQVEVAAVEKELGLDRLAEGPQPGSRAEAYFEIAVMVERMRAAAGRAGVRFKTGERFGFGAYAKDAPPINLVAGIHRQLRVMESVLTALFEAQPTELISVQRERPTLPKTRGKAKIASDAAPRRSGVRETGDFFEPNLAGSLRMAGEVEAVALRIFFTGDTDVLRSTLNALATIPLPVVVRAVEVVPATESGSGSGLKPSEESRAVWSGLSRFGVTIELVSPVAANGEVNL